MRQPPADDIPPRLPQVFPPITGRLHCGRIIRGVPSCYGCACFRPLPGGSIAACSPAMNVHGGVRSCFRPLPGGSIAAHCLPEWLDGHAWCFRPLPGGSIAALVSSPTALAAGRVSAHYRAAPLRPPTPLALGLGGFPRVSAHYRAAPLRHLEATALLTTPLRVSAHYRAAPLRLVEPKASAWVRLKCFRPLPGGSIAAGRRLAHARGWHQVFPPITGRLHCGHGRSLTRAVPVIPCFHPLPGGSIAAARTRTGAMSPARRVSAHYRAAPLRRDRRLGRLSTTARCFRPLPGGSIAARPPIRGGPRARWCFRPLPGGSIAAYRPVT